MTGVSSAQTRWATNLKLGLEYSAKNRIPSFIYFFDANAKPCKDFQDNTLRRQDVGAYLNSHFTPIALNVRKNPEAVEYYGVFRVPTIIILDPAGQEFSRIVTAPTTQKLLDQLKQLEPPSASTALATQTQIDDRAIFQESFDGLHGWNNEGSTANTFVQLSLVSGVSGQAFKVDYELIDGDWNYVSFHRILGPEEYFRLPQNDFTVIFYIAGAGGQNRLDFKMVDRDGTNYGACLDIPNDFKGHKMVLTSEEIGYLWGGTDERLDDVITIQIAVTPNKDLWDINGASPQGSVYLDELIIIPWRVTE